MVISPAIINIKTTHENNTKWHKPWPVATACANTIRVEQCVVFLCKNTI